MQPQADGEPVPGGVARGSLRSRLLILLTAALAPIMLLSGVSAILDAQRSLDDRRERLLVVAEQSVDALEKSLEQAEVLLVLFKDEIAKGKCAQVMSALDAAVPALVNVSNFDRQGVSSCSAAGATGHRIFNDLWLAELQFESPVVRTQSYLDPATKEWIFGIFVRLDEADGAFAGAAAFGLRADMLVDLAQNLDLPDDVDVALADKDGNVQSSRNFENIDPAWINETLETGKPRMFTARSADGKALDVVVQPAGSNGMFAVTSGRSPGLWNELTLSPIASLALPVLAYVAALLAVWIAVDQLVLHWIGRLQRAARVYGAGRYRFQAGDSFAKAPTEFGELARSMDEMAQNISERDSELRDAIALRDAAVKEIHHRVKNNLQIVTSFLSLQSRQISDPAARQALSKAQNRISALAIVHQTLYQNERLESVSLKPFLTSLVDHLREALGTEEFGIELAQSYIDCERSSDDAIPVALFLVEAVTNAVKFAFESGGRISISLTDLGEELLLLIEDNGRGFEHGDSSSRGLGGRLMEAFARQISAKLEVDSAPGQGCRVRLVIPFDC